MKRYTQLLQKMDASQAYEVKDFICPECRRSGINYFGLDKPKLVGWCDTDWGFMMIVECQSCFTKYRFHGTSSYDKKGDIDAFDHAIHCYVLADYFSNNDELKAL